MDRIITLTFEGTCFLVIAGWGLFLLFSAWRISD
jgi:hypothetical protein